MRRASLAGLVALLMSGNPGLAQLGEPVTQAPVRSTVVVIDQERLFSETRFGTDLNSVLDQQVAALAAENRQIEAALIAEEQELTDLRPTLPPEEFRALADEFDEKVTRIREEQDRKARVITSEREQGRRAFLDAVLPILGGIMGDYGAYAIVDRREIFLSDDRIDITDEAIRRIDASLVPVPPEERQGPEPAEPPTPNAEPAPEETPPAE